MDPVALATIAHELSVAEKVSGKTGTLRSEDLAKEAIDIATARLDVNELKAVALLTNKNLDEAVKKATEYDAKRKLSEKSGVKARGISGTVYIFNSNQGIAGLFAFPVQVAINGVPRGFIYPQQWGQFYVGDQPFNATYLHASDISGEVWTATVTLPAGNYQWNLPHRIP
jgi:hypothetical protein